MKLKAPFLLGIDIGTSSAKTVLCDVNGNKISSSSAEYLIYYPRPTWAQENPDDWWNATKKIIKQTIKEANVESEDIVGISVSGMAPNCVPVDKDCKPIRPAILWIDRRSTKEVEWLNKNIGKKEIEKICGNTTDTYFGGPKWLWFKNNEPELYKKTWKILQTHSYIIFQLTGEIVTDYSQAGLCTPFFDLKNKCWSEEICKATGISMDLLPEIHSSYEIIGKITDKAAKETGLKEGTPVVTGAGDFACATLGCGVAGSIGESAQMLGTAGNILVPVGKKFNPDERLLNTVYVNGDYLMLGSIFAGGIVKWFTNEFVFQKKFGKNENIYDLLSKKAQEIPAGSNGLILLPYFMGERTPIWNPYARGVYVGLTPSHNRIHMYRALLEGVAYAFRHMTDIIKERGIDVKSIISSNGGSKSNLWRQIFADVLNIPISYIKDSGGTLIGDIILAGIGTGYIKNFDIAKKWFKINEVSRPNKRNHKIYSGYYKIYKDVYEHLKQDFVNLYDLSVNIR
jgi:xylulokinase